MYWHRFRKYYHVLIILIDGNDMPFHFKLSSHINIKFNPTKNNYMPENKILKIIIAFFLPPLAVALHSGIGKKFLINLILTLLFWLPGFIHALLVIT